MSSAHDQYWTYRAYLTLIEEAGNTYEPYCIGIRNAFSDYAYAYDSLYTDSLVHHIGMNKNGKITDIDFDWDDVYFYIDYNDGTSGCYTFDEFKFL